MIEQMLPDIPRLYTALAEWIACVIYILPLKKKVNTKGLIWRLALMLVLQCGVQLIAGSLDVVFWVPGMLVAVLVMYGCIYICCDISKADVGYCCARAFITAEFAASLGWQLYCLPIVQNASDTKWVAYVVGAGTYIVVFGGVFFLERRRLSTTTKLNVNIKELVSAGLIAIAVFAISNVSFVVNTGDFREPLAALFFIRTVVDFSGLTMLYSQLEQRNEMRLRREIEALDNVLHRQYENYRQSKENNELLERKHHDLKQQIAVIRMEMDPLKREGYLEEMENLIKLVEIEHDTGNKILDTVLSTKSKQCIENGITMTCMIDGKLLDFMEVMDICSIFGNALDNAIESVVKIEDKDKRLIRLAMYCQNDLLLVRFENYVEQIPKFVDGLPKTTKGNKAYHGYGIKSIKQVAEKYGGNLTIHIEHNWFIMRILFPRQTFPR